MTVKKQKSKKLFGKGHLIAAFLRCAVLFCLLCVAAFGETLEKYKEEIIHLREDIEYLLESDEDSRAEQIKDYEQEVSTKLEELFAKSKRIEFQGTSVETDNRWLIERFKQIQKEPSKRFLILTEMRERLSAIEKTIDELEKAQARGRSKDEEKQKLNEILKREEYRKPDVEQESFIQRILRAIDEWFGRQTPRPDVPTGTSEGLRSASVVLQFLLYAAIIAAIGFVIWRFGPFLASKFRRPEKEEKDNRVILGEKLSRDEDSRSLFDEAERLAREGNLRGAIRKGYIALLCDLSDRKIIGLARHKTNRDYLRDVRKKSALHQNMSGLTKNFERHWYGLENAERDDWEEFRENYQRRSAVCSSQLADGSSSWRLEFAKIAAIYQSKIVKSCLRIMNRLEKCWAI